MRTSFVRSFAQRVFLCTTDCTSHPDACINAELYYSTADALVANGFADAGYNRVHIDDCWAAKERHPVTKEMVPDPARFPGANASGVKLVGDYLATRNLSLGLYVVNCTCMMCCYVK